MLVIGIQLFSTKVWSDGCSSSEDFILFPSEADGTEAFAGSLRRLPRVLLDLIGEHWLWWYRALGHAHYLSRQDVTGRVGRRLLKFLTVRDCSRCQEMIAANWISFVFLICRRKLPPLSGIITSGQDTMTVDCHLPTSFGTTSSHHMKKQEIRRGPRPSSKKEQLFGDFSIFSIA